jgi:hypothetical protein
VGPTAYSVACAAVVSSSVQTKAHKNTEPVDLFARARTTVNTSADPQDFVGGVPKSRAAHLIQVQLGSASALRHELPRSDLTLVSVFISTTAPFPLQLHERICAGPHLLNTLLRMALVKACRDTRCRCTGRAGHRPRGRCLPCERLHGTGESSRAGLERVTKVSRRALPSVPPRPPASSRISSIGSCADMKALT